MPSVDSDPSHVSRPSLPNHVSVAKSAVQCRAFSEKFPRPRHRLHLVREQMNPRDRFVPQRSYSGNTVAKHHVRKLPVELAVHEKLLRRQEISEEPFGSRRQQMAVPDVQLYIEDILQAPHMAPHLLDSEVDPRQYSTSRQRVTPRQVSLGAVWNVGGASIVTRGPWLGIANGQTGYSGGKVAAPMYFARYEFNEEDSSFEETEIFRSRLAAAMNMDLAHRQLAISKVATSTKIGICHALPHYEESFPIDWRDCAWKRAIPIIPDTRGRQARGRPPISAMPFCVLFTSPTQDDYYRSGISYCHTSALLAVAELGTIKLWSTMVFKCVAEFSVRWYIEDEVTALAFSSSSGRKSILAAGTECGYIHLWDTPRLRKIFTWRFMTHVTCVAFKPTTTRCLSAIFPGIEVSVEHLAVGDEFGMVWYYAVEVNPLEGLSRVTLLANISAHYTRVCSITWSPDNRYLATSGDDNICLLFEMKQILHNQHSSNTAMESPPRNGIIPRLRLQKGRLNGVFSQFARILGNHSRVILTDPAPNFMSDTSSVSEHSQSVSMGRAEVPESIAYQRVRGGTLDSSGRPQFQGISRLPFRRVASAYYPRRFATYAQTATYVPQGNHIHRFEHSAAIKAVAFAPWQPTLLATGGGITDCTVHFYHAPTGSCLAKIYMWAQVTGLVWSKTHREITVVLGTPQHDYDHPYRVVVFAWPSCEQVTAIPWNIGINAPSYPHLYVPDRALSVISIPNFRNIKFEKGDVDFDPKDECIAIVTPNFVICYRVWRKPHRAFTGSAGIMHSEILEALDGIENPRNEVIR